MMKIAFILFGDNSVKAIFDSLSTGVGGSVVDPPTPFIVEPK